MRTRSWTAKMCRIDYTKVRIQNTELVIKKKHPTSVQTGISRNTEVTQSNVSKSRCGTIKNVSSVADLEPEIDLSEFAQRFHFTQECNQNRRKRKMTQDEPNDSNKATKKSMSTFELRPEDRIKAKANKSYKLQNNRSSDAQPAKVSMIIQEILDKCGVLLSLGNDSLKDSPTSRRGCYKQILCLNTFFEKKLADLKLAYEQQVQILQAETAELKRQYAEQLSEKQEEVTAAKKHRWCTYCLEPSTISCCSNDSYCSDTCQKRNRNTNSQVWNLETSSYFDCGSFY